MRQAVRRDQQPIVSHHLADVVASPVDVVEGNSETPNEAFLSSLKDFFTQSLAAGVEAAVVLRKEKFGRPLLESTSVRFGSCENAA